VLIEGKKIVAVAQPQCGRRVIDASGMIVMPGFITTHHHQYETLQRAIIPDGLLAILLEAIGRRKTMYRSSSKSGRPAGFPERQRPIHPSGTWGVSRMTLRITTSRSS